MATETAVYFRYGDLLRPALLVIDRVLPDARPDVQIVIRSEADEHLSLHREDDGGLLLTHQSPDKPPSVWDELRVKVARAEGYKQPEKHGQYYQHHRIYPESNSAGWYLVGRMIELANAADEPRYSKRPHVIVGAPAARFMLHMNLRTSSQQPLDMTEPRVATSLGELYFTVNLPSRSGR